MAQEDEGVAAAADVDDAPTVARQLGSQGIAAYQACVAMRSGSSG